MNFYFCFRIILFVVCFIPIPTFSTKSPSSIINNIEQENPIACYIAQESFLLLIKFAINDLEISIKTMEKNAKQFQIDIDALKEELNAEDIELGDVIKLEFLINRVFKNVQNSENNLKNDILKKDENNEGTVTKEYAEKDILKSELFKRLPKKILDFVLVKFTNDQNQFNYRGLMLNFLNLYQNKKSDHFIFIPEDNEWKIKF
ncbi:uncharacterized protein LOC126895004 [Daktulosphaira vitifoliae]|uniref:uncharacterized protein LOC126895004 n=1 Tax=Daktulosphaira vitifoliae TaxID=58002 RepID=UPI0021A9A3D4|nr:uncharacterized protein LOC126895004 [Daktulosphaira vitifoliae]